MYALGKKQETERGSLPDELHGKWVSCESGSVIVVVLCGGGGKCSG